MSSWYGAATVATDTLTFGVYGAGVVVLLVGFGYRYPKASESDKFCTILGIAAWPIFALLGTVPLAIYLALSVLELPVILGSWLRAQSDRYAVPGSEHTDALTTTSGVRWSRGRGTRPLPPRVP